ncbi:RadC family protein [Guggenheimella bovis]
MLKDLLPLERPREKLSHFGVSSLSNAELIAVLLRTGSKEENVVQQATRLLFESGGFEALSQKSLVELQAIKGIGLSKASAIQCAFELSRRSIASVSDKRVHIDNPDCVYELLKGKLVSKTREVFVVLQLNTKNDVVFQEIISEGTLNSSLVHPREVFQSAIRNGACSILVCHNHPSGDATPSEEDILITKRLKEAGELLGIALIDHVIIAKSQSWSFRAHGML